MPERWTIRDIAGEAGVSTKTVSHVLNGKPGVHNETRAHVLRIIEKVGYHPHLGARMLRGHATVSVGVTMPAPPGAAPLGQSFFVWLYEELFRVFGSRGYYLTFDLNPYATGPNSDYARGIWEQAFQACVLAGPLATSDTTVARIHATGTPYLALGRLDSFPECSCAVVDYEQGAYRGIQYLIERGHKRIGMLKAFDGFQPGVERQRGYVRAMEEAGLPLAAGLVRSVTFGTHDIADTVHRILEMGDVTALLDASGSEDGEAIREGARKAGRAPGKDFEVVAWTYEYDVAVLAEACAHVWLPVREAAAQGFEELAEWIDGAREGPIQVLHSPTLCETATKGEIARPKRLFETLE